MTGTASNYVVFVDESGDHSLESINQDWPLFVLSFCVFPIGAYVHQVTPAIRQLKFDFFGHDLVILHEHDIRKKKAGFAQLNKEARDAFLNRLTDVIAETDMTMIAVVIDKNRHKAKYSKPEHPYHLAMQFGLERVAAFMAIQGQRDRETRIVFEARGAKEDAALELEFRRVCDGENRSGKPYPFSILIADKKTNSEGLQLADLTARPCGLHVLRPEQEKRAWDVIKGKLYGGRHDCISGNGLKVFP